MGARNRVGSELSYRLVRLHRLAELVPWNRFLGSLNIYKFGLRFLHDKNAFILMASTITVARMKDVIVEWGIKS
jgi:hypothetical protein